MSTAEGCRRRRQRDDGDEQGEYEREYRFEVRSDEDGDDMLELEGVEVIIVGEVGSKWLVCRKRPKSEKGRGDCGCLGEAGERTRLDFGVVLFSRDSKRVTSLDTAILPEMEDQCADLKGDPSGVRRRFRK